MDAIGRAFVASPAAEIALMRTPADLRSVANAVVIWNSGWVPSAALPGAPLHEARAVVEQSLGLTNDACLDEQMTGPRFVPIAYDDETLLLVFGSGVWRWRDVMELDEGAVRPKGPDR